MSSLRISRRRAFTLIELLVVVLIIGILIAVAAPTFLGQTVKAQNSSVEQQLTVTRLDAKAQYTSAAQTYASWYAQDNGGASTAGDTTFAAALTSSEPQYSYNTLAWLTLTSHAVAGVIGVQVNSASSVTACELTQTGTAFCLRADENASLTSLTAADGSSPFSLSSAQAAGGPTDVVYSTGSNVADAVCVVNVAAGTGSLSACKTGQVGWATAAPGNPSALITGAIDNTVPAIAGGSVAGSTLTASPGSWTGNPGFAYQWQDCNTSGKSCVSISGATTSTYQTAVSDVGDTIVVQVTASNGAGTSIVPSPATATITLPLPAAATASFVRGQGTVGNSFSNGFSNNGTTSGNGVPNPTGLRSPRGIAVDSSGGVYVADEGNNRVLYYPAGVATPSEVYGQAGSFSTSYANGLSGVESAYTLSTPTGVALDSAGNLYVLDRGNNRVLEFAPNNGCTAANLPTATCGKAEAVYGQGGSYSSWGGGLTQTGFVLPLALTLDGAGNLYVADFNRVLEFAPNNGCTAPNLPTATCGKAEAVYGQGGSYTLDKTGQLPVEATSASDLDSADALAVDGAGDLYVADSGNSRVLEFAPNNGCTGPNLPTASCGIAKAVYGQAGNFGAINTGTGAASLNSPSGLAVDGLGDLYISDVSNNRVLYYPAGTGAGCTALNTPSSTCGTGTKVYGQGATGTNFGSSSSTNSTGLSGPYGVALDSSGNLYVADASNNRAIEFP